MRGLGEKEKQFMPGTGNFFFDCFVIFLVLSLFSCCQVNFVT